MATSTLGSGTLVLAGTTSGTTTVTATAVAGTTTLTLPAATDTLVGKATTDTLTNKTLTGAVMNGTLGATTPSTVAATTLTTSSTVTHNGGTANGVAYLDGSKVLTTGSALVFDGTNLGVGVTPSAWFAGKTLQLGNDGAVSAYGQQTELSTNSYLSGGGTYKYMTNGLATRYSSTSGQHQWFNAASGTAGNTITFTQAMTLDASGNLLVGGTGLEAAERLNVRRGSITTSALTVNVVNSAAISTSKAASALLRIASNASGADSNIQVTDSTLNNYYFGGNNGGAYVMANTNGVRLSNGGTSWASDSDERLKDIIEPIINAAEKVSSLRAVIGKYKTDKEGTRRSFLIAQDVQAVLPEAVFDEQGTLMLAYTETIPLLVAAIKEQSAIITQLTARITALEGA